MRLVTPASRAEARRRCDRRARASTPRVNGDSGTLRQLDAAIAALRSMVPNVASADALARLSQEVRLLSSRVARLKGADGGESLSALDQSTLGTRGVKDPTSIRAAARLQRAGSHRPQSQGNRRGARSVTVLETRPLLLVSGAAAILVAAFITGMTMLEAVQPRVHVPTASGVHRIASRQAPSFLISPVPIGSQSFKRRAAEARRLQSSEGPE